MRKLAFLTASLGLIILAVLIKFQAPLVINSESDLLSLEDNQKVSISSQVIDEKISSTSRTLILENNITLYCPCKYLESLKGKNIAATGIIDTYQKTRINILTLQVLN
jgi:hypothetical protein